MPRAESKTIHLIEEATPLLEAVPPTAVRAYEDRTGAMLDHVNQSISQRPDFQILVGAHSTDQIFLNHENHVRFMASQFQVQSPATFVRTIVWVFSAYMARGATTDYFRHELQAWKKAVRMFLSPEAAGPITVVYDWMFDHADDFAELAAACSFAVEVDEELRPVFDNFLASLLEPDMDEAMNLARREIHSSQDIRRWWLGVIKPAMYEVGYLWARGQITVASEHLATSITQRVISNFYPMILDGERDKGTLIVSCGPRELHEIGPRILADLLELDGWDVRYLGANMPQRELVELVRDTRPLAMLLSTTLQTNMGQAKSLIDAVRNDPELKGIYIIIGGQAFTGDPEIAKRMSADECLFEVEEAQERLRQLSA